MFRMFTTCTTHNCHACGESFACPSMDTPLHCGLMTGLCDTCAESVTDYCTYPNYPTWNVSGWITECPELWELVERYESDYPTGSYLGLVDMYIRPLYGDRTPDGISWTDPALDYDRLTRETVLHVPNRR